MKGIVQSFWVLVLVASCGSEPSHPDVSADWGENDTGSNVDVVENFDTGMDLDTPQDAFLELQELLDDLPLDTSTCIAGQKRCLDNAHVELCQEEQWFVAQICLDTQRCIDGFCAKDEPCQPGHVEGCYSLSAMSVCHSSGLGYVPFPCGEDEKCVEGKCGELACNPGVRQCAGPNSYQICEPSGGGFGEILPCEEGEVCIGGQCLDGCSGDIKYNQSNVGCEFWSVDLGQWDLKEGETGMEQPASPIPHAVVVGNPNEIPVTVTFEVGDGTPVEVVDPVVPPGQSRAFLMPVLSLQVTSITRKTIRLSTNHPVTAAQFNPPSNEDYVYTSDASLLYPISILGKEHFVMSRASRLGMEMPMIGKMPSAWGYFTVIAVEPGTTTVHVGPLTSATEAGEEIPEYAMGETVTFQLEQWEVLHLNAKAIETMVVGDELTGTHVYSTQRVAVFGGHDCDTLGDSNCDHFETQLLPLEAWGETYVAARMNTPAPNEYRIMSGSDGNVVTTKPNIAGLNGITLNKGEWVHVASNGSFEVTGVDRLQVVQFVVGNSSGGSVLVDPSMTVLVPVAQFRLDYPILVPTAYEQDFVSVVREAGSTVTLNGDVSSSGGETIQGTNWEVINLPVSAGVNILQGDAPFGLISYGYANKVSYAYPGGLNGATGN